MALTPNWNLITVVGTYVDLSGNPLAGTVSFTPIGTVIEVKDAVYKQIIIPATVTATLNASGTFSINLPASDDPDVTPNGWTYLVVETFGGFTNSYSITVPISTVGTLDLSTIAPATPANGLSSYTLLSATNALATRVSTLEANPAGPDYARRYALLFSRN
jgi:hypothetical protein